jgi:hypothetical protein
LELLNDGKFKKVKQSMVQASKSTEYLSTLLQKTRDIAECIRLALEVLEDDDLILTEPQATPVEDKPTKEKKKVTFKEEDVLESA